MYFSIFSPVLLQSSSEIDTTQTSSSEDVYLAAMRVRQVIVQRQQHHKSEKHPYCTQKVPDVVVVVELEECALLVELARLRWSQLDEKKIIINRYGVIIFRKIERCS